MLKNINKKLLLIFSLALFLRLSLIFVAYHGDLNNNISWGKLAVERGLNGFYGFPSESFEKVNWEYSAPNQPPLTILLFAGLRTVWLWVERFSWFLNNNIKIFPSGFIWFWELKGMILLVKLPSIFADLGIGLMIYHYVINKTKDERKALILTVVWLSNPIIWYNSSVWGQTDSVVNLLGLAGVLALMEKNLVRFVLFFSLSFLFKGSLGIFIPVLGFVAFWKRYKLNDWLKAFVYCLVTITLISLWFHPHLNLFVWLFNLYKERILPGEIGYLTANAFNFWWLVDSSKTLDSALFLGLPARALGFLVTLAGIVGIDYWLIKKKITNERIFVSLLIVTFVSFLFMTRIHERYLYPFFPYATFLLSSVPVLLIPYIIFSIVHFLNLYHLFWAPPFPLLEGFYKFPVFAQTLSIINIVVFILLLRLLKHEKDII